jgi:MarR family transcriptional regulator, organic hydroperoxide resistance regulator
MYFVSNALARKVEKMANEAWKKTGLSPSHAYLLMIVIDTPGVQPGTLSEELQLSPSTITRLIEKLEEKKLLIRTNEGKMTNVFPSAKAKEMKPLLKECVETFYKNYSSVLGKEESLKLVQNMSKVADKLE